MTSTTLANDRFFFYSFLDSGANFNEKMYPDQKKCFTAKYVGSIEVKKPSGTVLLAPFFSNFNF